MTLPAVVFSIALALAGECGPLGPTCELEVARTLAARMASPEFPHSWPVVLQAYHGQAGPTASSVAIATALLTGSVPPGPFLYVYSAEDRACMGWPPGDRVIAAHGLELHFSANWPASQGIHGSLPLAR